MAFDRISGTTRTVEEVIKMPEIYGVSCKNVVLLPNFLAL